MFFITSEKRGYIALSALSLTYFFWNISILLRFSSIVHHGLAVLAIAIIVIVLLADSIFPEDKVKAVN
ncbi:MAG: hypothetical protein ACLFR1_14315, partial [Spirochaetia bacterium]